MVHLPLMISATFFVSGFNFSLKNLIDWFSLETISHALGFILIWICLSQQNFIPNKEEHSAHNFLNSLFFGFEKIDIGFYVNIHIISAKKIYKFTYRILGSITFINHITEYIFYFNFGTFHNFFPFIKELNINLFLVHSLSFHQIFNLPSMISKVFHIAM